LVQAGCIGIIAATWITVGVLMWADYGPNSFDAYVRFLNRRLPFVVKAWAGLYRLVDRSSK
jgi:hypothetical protein